MSEGSMASRAGQAALGVAGFAQCFGWMLLQGGTFDVLDQPARNTRLGIVFAVVAALSVLAAAGALVATRATPDAPLRRAGPVLALLLGTLAAGLSALFLSNS